LRAVHTTRRHAPPGQLRRTRTGTPCELGDGDGCRSRSGCLKRRRASHFALALIVAAFVASMAPVRAEVIDRILAVVDKEVVMLSDVSAALRFGLVASPPGGTDSVRTALDGLIARQLELGEANRYQPPEPPKDQLDARMEAVRARFRTAQDFDQALAQTGLSSDRLRARLRDDLRIAAYLNQRFGGAREPTDQEIAEYYRAHVAEFTAAGAVRPLAEVRTEIRTRLAAAQREALMKDWLEGLRRRTEISDLYVAEK
jgi:hypothetical protein